MNLCKTNISWCSHVWNPVVGCPKPLVSKGCEQCYARKIHNMRYKAWKSGRWPDAPKQYHKPFEVIQLFLERLNAPLRKRRPSVVFVDSMGDLFHDEVPFEYITKVYTIIEQCKKHKKHTFVILTKRPDRLLAISDDGCPVGLDNIYLGLSISTQEDADKWLPIFLQVPGKKILSIEPILENIDICGSLTPVRFPDGKLTSDIYDQQTILQILVGCESGSNPRIDSHTNDNIRSIVEQSHSADAPCFVKQVAADGKPCSDVNKFPADLKDRNLIWNGFPVDKIGGLTGAAEMSPSFPVGE